MRLLLLHTDEAMLNFLPRLLGARAAKLEVRDGNTLDQAAAVSLIKKEFDCIILNLRLPVMLSVRIAELVHLARVPTRLVLISGAPQELGPGLSLYDSFIRAPFYGEVSLDESLEQPLSEENRGMRSQEHLDIAILNFLQRCGGLVPGSRGALHAFGLYRDAYLHRPRPQVQALRPASFKEQLDFLAKVSPLGFNGRLGNVGSRVKASRFYSPAQKCFLASQFNHLLDSIGLTLMEFRKETNAVLEGLEQFGSIAESDAAGADSTGLRESLLRCSAPMRYVHQGITQIVRLLPGAGNSPAMSRC